MDMVKTGVVYYRRARLLFLIFPNARENAENAFSLVVYCKIACKTAVKNRKFQKNMKNIQKKLAKI